MKIKCQYCGTMFDDTLTQCPHCSAPSEGVVRTEKSQPLTIQQLQQWYAARGLPPYKTTHFFIGEDYRGPKAFGIYRDESTGNVVVYKNLTNGERNIRYEGTDEAYAVNELYMRLKQEIIQQKRNALKRSSGAGVPAHSIAQKIGQKRLIRLLLLGIVILSMAISLLDEFSSAPRTGYYRYNDTVYYHAFFDSGTDDWYYYDTDSVCWEHTYDDLPTELAEDSSAKDFYYTPTWDSSTQTEDFDDPLPFTASEYAAQYESDDSYDSDDGWDNYNDDSDFDWDIGDSWDIGGTDWDSAW